MEERRFYRQWKRWNSGAEKAGLASGDIIKKLDNVEISKFSDMRGFLSSKRPNDVVNVTVLRNGDERVIPVTLVKNQTFIIPQLGTLKPASKDDLKTFNTNHGVRLAELTRIDYYKKYWNRIGIHEGVIVTNIDGNDIHTIEDVESIMSRKSQYDPITIELINKDGEKERYSFGR